MGVFFLLGPMNADIHDLHNTENSSKGNLFCYYE